MSMQEQDSSDGSEAEVVEDNGQRVRGGGHGSTNKRKRSPGASGNERSSKSHKITAVRSLSVTVCQVATPAALGSCYSLPSVPVVLLSVFLASNFNLLSSTLNFSILLQRNGVQD